MYKCILVGYDGSKAARKAVEKAISLAKLFGSRFILVTVVPTPVPLVGELLVPEPINISEIVENAKKELEKLSKELKEVHEVNVEYKVVQGDPAEEIVKLAEKEKCDLIVLGRRGAGRLERILLGSVSEKVARLARNADVLIVEHR